MSARSFVLVVVTLLVLIGIVSSVTYFRSQGVLESEHSDVISCAYALYAGAQRSGMLFDSQCLGICGNYSVDIVHVPRSEQDDLGENHCVEYRLNVTSGFIELDSEGRFVRISS